MTGVEVPVRAEAMPQSLCETCANVREVRTARSRFLLCELSLADAAYPKYPLHPVVRCTGYQHKSEAKPGAPGDSRTQAN